jgi:uncharacterized protein YdaU (DUF1376 family)
MHYYKFDISAWALHTAHLTPEEEACYFRLVNFYYDTEQPIPVDIAPVVRKLRMNAYVHIVETVLHEFFQQVPEGWTHNRCDKEIADYHAKAERNREVGKLGGRPKKQKETQAVTDENPDQSLTINYKLQTTNHKLNKTLTTPDGVSDVVWQDFITLRKAKKASVTQTALKGILREANKAGIPLEDALRICCERGWAGFKADWILHHIDNMPVRTADKNLAAARAIFGDERMVTDVRNIETKQIT